MVNGLGPHLRNGGSGHQPDSPPPYRTRPPSLEHPQDIAVDGGDIYRQQNVCNIIENVSSLRLTTFSV